MSSFPPNPDVPPAVAGSRHFAMHRPTVYDHRVGLSSSIAADWPEIDASILEEKRGVVPPFPLDLLAQPWRDWVNDTASSAGVSPDYVAQAMLAALAGLSGAGMAVRITPTWSEPLVLWQVAVGEPSSGKTRSLAPMRRLLGSIEEERRTHDDGRRERHAALNKEAGLCGTFVPSQVVVAETSPEPIADIVRGNPRGVRTSPAPNSHDLEQGRLVRVVGRGTADQDVIVAGAEERVHPVAADQYVPARTADKQVFP